jgi:hypothetical protein
VGRGFLSLAKKVSTLNLGVLSYFLFIALSIFNKEIPQEKQGENTPKSNTTIHPPSCCVLYL